MTSIRIPRLLDEDCREKARLIPLSLALQLRLTPLSTAEMVLADCAPTPVLRDLVELYDENGSVGIFRVVQVEQDVGQTLRVKLQHSLCTLQDSVSGEISFTGTVREALEMLLTLQNEPRWILGNVEFPEDARLIFSTECTDLLSALQALLEMLPDGYALSFNQAGNVWVMHLRALSDQDVCEGRLSRNLRSVRITSDASRLCTRVYPYGAKVEQRRINLTPDTGVEYLQSTAAEELGVISRTIRSDRIFDVPTLRSVAEMYLERHSTPEMTILVDALDLFPATSEELDAIRLGRMCRLAMPDAGLILSARITSIDKPDVFGSPTLARLTLHTHSHHTTDSTEIAELLLQVTTNRLLGGTVAQTNHDNRAEGSYPSPIVHGFEVSDGAALLDARAVFTPDSGVSVTELRIDDVYPPNSVWSSGAFSLMPYLKRDAQGCIAAGRHKLILHPSTGVYGELGAVSSRITLTTIGPE